MLTVSFVAFDLFVGLLVGILAGLLILRLVKGD